MRAYDIVIVGAGVAGLATALAAAPRRVLLVSRGQPGDDGSSAWAQGGIAAAVGAGDDPAQHADDTLRAGAGHNLREAVELLTAAAPQTIAWLAALGLDFDRDGDGPALGREGGHHRHRILHVGGDATGAHLMRVLSAAAAEAGHIEHLPATDVDGLLFAEDRVAGVCLRCADGGRLEVAAGATVLATGGIGGLYRYTTNPAGIDGSGLALAQLAGAKLADLEFVQFHPTALAPSAGSAGCRLPLVTEALRGAGAVLVDRQGRRLMAGRHPLADLGPRDIVARAVWQWQAAGEPVYLDARMLGATFRRRFPTVHASCTARGIDPAQAPIPIVPAQHFHMGGIAVDLDGASSVAGLHAVGEVACNGVHGANRLASNSLLEGAVFGRRLGTRLAAATPSVARMADARCLPPAADAAALDQVRTLMWQHCGLLRDGDGLRRARRALAEPTLAGTRHGGLAAAIVDAALARPSSLGSHHRDDARALAASG